MTTSPIYDTKSVSNPAYHLRYTWTGWPSSAPFPEQPNDDFWEGLDTAWEADGIRRLEGQWTPESIQFTCSVKPTVRPVLFTSRMKGRLQHALRIHGQPTKFSRKVAFRWIGDNRRRQVESYIEQQVKRSDYIDPGFKESLKPFSVVNPNVDLSQPTETNSGRYWYNVHLVLVVANRWTIADLAKLATLRDTSFEIAIANGHQISRLSVMPDHWHAALRGNIDRSPEEIALEFMNSLANATGRNAIWQCGYYAGTFGEYDMNAVREFESLVSTS